ncbi:MAG: acetylornithine deacetylase [Acidiferrobacteraceae bacterium]|nr:acetylornithine deacetylase [Acidiferrobacteraceae bacterium]
MPDISTIATILKDLVAFDTTSRESNLDFIGYVEDYLRQYGIKSVLVEDNENRKANLYATISESDTGGVMLSGHTDVVPVDGQAWLSDPFVLKQEQDRLYGRGTADMKGFIACVLAWVPTMVDAELSKPINIALSYDEEVGCLGVRKLIDFMAEMPTLPSFGIIGEPTNMKIINAHKGKRAMSVKIDGFSAHSAYPNEGVNAIEIATQLISFLRSQQLEIQENGPFDDGYTVPHSTIHVGTIRGGTALNIVPDRCSFNFEIRHLPTDDIEQIVARFDKYARIELEPKMKAVQPSCRISIEPLSDYPGLYTALDSPVIDFVQSLVKEEDHPHQISFGSEAGLFNRRVGIPCVVCGPGSISEAHRPNEYVSLKQLEKCNAMLRRLVDCLSWGKLPLQ